MLKPQPLRQLRRGTRTLSWHLNCVLDISSGSIVPRDHIRFHLKLGVHGTKGTPVEAPETTLQPVCFLCRQEGHFAKKCLQQRQRKVRTERGCFLCGGQDHFERGCVWKGVDKEIPTISRNGKEDEGTPILKGRVCGYECRLLLDSGARVSVARL